VGSGPGAIAVNPVSNLVYVANSGSGTVSVINPASKTVVATVTAGSSPDGIAVNLETGQIYVANKDSNNLSVIDGSGVKQLPINTAASYDGDSYTVSTSPLPVTHYAAPSFSITATSAYSDSNVYKSLTGLTNPPPTAVYYWIDDGSGVSGHPEWWTRATNRS
jgi:YVTN family beta-propeller protein